MARRSWEIPALFGKDADEAKKIIGNLEKKYLGREDFLYRICACIMNRYNREIFGMNFQTYNVPFIKNGIKLFSAVDHPFKSTVKDWECYGFEPYTLNYRDLKDIIKYCELNQTGVRITGKSGYFAGMTVNVSFGSKGSL